MIRPPYTKAYTILVFTGFVFWIVGCLGGADAFLYWAVKWKWADYSRATFVVESARYEDPRRGGPYFYVEGQIGDVKVEGRLVDAAHVAREHTTTKLPTPYSSKGVDVYWNGESKGGLIQTRSVNIVEASYIDHPPVRACFGPPCLLLGIILLGYGVGSRIIQERRLTAVPVKISPERSAGHKKPKGRRRRR